MEVRWTVVQQQQQQQKNEQQIAKLNDHSLDLIPINNAAYHLNPSTTLESILSTGSNASEMRLQLRIERPLKSARNELSATEWNWIGEVQRAISVFENENSLPLTGKAATLPQAFCKFSSHYIKRIVAYCKQIAAFRSLNREDQFALLQSFYTEIHAIRFAFNYKEEDGGVRMIEVVRGICPVEIKFSPNFISTE